MKAIKAAQHNTPEGLEDKDLRFWASVFESSTDLIEIRDASAAGAIRYLNKAGRELLGILREEELARLEGIDHRVKDAVLMVALDEALTAEGRWNGRSVFYHYRTRQPIPVDVSAFLVVDGRGRALARALIARRIPSGPGVEAPQDRGIQAQAVLAAIPDAVFRCKTDGTLLNFHVPSQEWRLLLEPERVVGSNVRDMNAPPGVVNQILSAIHEASATGRLQTIEYAVDTPSGSAEFEARIVPSGSGEIVAIARDITDNKRAEERMRALTGQLLTAQEEERRRIARELHDDVTQKLALLGIELDLARAAKDTASLDHQLTALRTQVTQLTERVRDLSHTFHPGALEHSGLEAALESHIQELARLGIRVGFQSRDVPRGIPHAAAVVLYRSAQEALRNALKHSGAESIDVVLCGIQDDAGTRLRLSVIDNGCGFNTEHAGSGTGLGLLSIGERVRLVHGTLHVHSVTGEGTRLEVEIPLAEEAS